MNDAKEIKKCIKTFLIIKSRFKIRFPYYVINKLLNYFDKYVSRNDIRVPEIVQRKKQIS